MAHPIEYSVIRVQNADTLGNFIIQISCTANITFIYTFNIYLCFVHYLIFALIALYSFEAAVPQKRKLIHYLKTLHTELVKTSIYGLEVKLTLYSKV